jgi:hypothetical protein
MEGVYEAVKFAVDLFAAFPYLICLLLAEKCPPPKDFIQCYYFKNRPLSNMQKLDKFFSILPAFPLLPC